MNKKVHKSNCFMCHGGCGVRVHIHDGKLIKIEGDPDSPLSKGTMCSKGLASLQHVYNADRLNYPMRRVGKRGEGKWERISWRETYDAIARRINEIKEKYGPEAIAIGHGTGRHPTQFIYRFANALGTPNRCCPGTAQCFLPRLAVSIVTFGDFLIADYYGSPHPNCIFVWGHNPAVTSPDGEIAAAFLRTLNQGAKLIVVDPRLSETAAKADIWLQIRPGSDDALALAILNTIINENLYDKEFVRSWTHGFGWLAERTKEFTPEWAEKVTWIPAEKIKEAARLFATSKPACIDWGVALEHTPNAIQTLRAVSLLPAITGNIDLPGGNIFGMHVLRPFPYLSEELPFEIAKKRLGSDRFKLLTNPDANPIPSAHTPTVFEAMRTGTPYPIKAFLIFTNNALLSYANSRKVFDALSKLDFLLVADLYMTPTAEFADVVLPAASWLECDAMWGYPYVADNVVLAQQKLIQIADRKSDEEIMTELARVLKLKTGTESPEEIYNYLLEPLGLSFTELKQKGFASVPFRYEKYKASGFRTPSGKIEIYSTIMEKLGYDPLPYYEEPPEGPFSTPALLEEYPIILTTGARSPVFFHSEYRQIQSLRKRHPDPVFDVNPKTAAEYNIRHGDWAWIETLRGRARFKSNLTHGIDPRVVNIQHGWWFPEKPGPEHGVWESNANILTSDMPPYDPAMGTYQLRALLCKIYPA